MSKERPILFNEAMVRAILEGRKTQTRRVMKPQPRPVPEDSPCSPDHWWPCRTVQSMVCVEAQFNNPAWQGIAEVCCPHGQTGDRLWVRETWRGVVGINPPDEPLETGVARYIPDQEHCRRVEYKATQGPDAEPWRPSIHMPRWASRITLEITGVRVEQLQDIREEDAKAEGVHSYDDFPTNSCCPQCQGQGVHGAAGPNLGWVEVDCQECETAEQRFRHLWESINGPGSWDANPWVWVVEFRRVDQEGSSDA